MIVSVMGGDTPVALVVVTIVLVVPSVVGVPDISPVLVFTLNPGGNGDALKLTGLPVAVI